MRPQRPCLGCGALTRNPAGRCRTCEADKQRVRNAQPHRQAYNDADYRSARRAARLGRYGPCVDCGGTDDLTLDHKVPLILGGRNHPSNWAVRCRDCNSRKGARTS